MQTKVEICGVNTSGLPVLSAKKTDELLKKIRCRRQAGTR